VGQATFSLSAKLEERQLEEGLVGDMVCTILFILTNLQHSIADSMILSRTAVVKGMDFALIQEPSYFEGLILWVSLFQEIPCSLETEQTDIKHVSLLRT
jgi:hypothetical protein